MEMPCFLNTRLNSECGSDRGKEEIVSLGEFKDNISGHLASCHLSRESLSEFQLILARSGLYDVSADQLSQMKICPKHRHQIGKFWRPLRTCQYPGHEGKASRNVKGTHVINLEIAKDIQRLFSQTVPIGSRKHIIIVILYVYTVWQICNIFCSVKFFQFENRQM